MSIPALAWPSIVDSIAAFGQVRNNATTALTADIVFTDAVIPVTSTADFPTSGFATIGNGNGTVEIFCYGGKTANSFTGVVRGFDATIALDWSEGTKVQQRFVAKDKTLLIDALRTLQATLGINPQGSDPTVRSRLDNLEAIITGAATLVTAFGVIDDSDSGGAPPGGPSDGDTYVVNNWGAGTYVGAHVGDPYFDGDIARYDTGLADWRRVLLNSVGFVPINTRLVVIDTGAAGSFLTHDDEIAVSNGDGTFTFKAPLDGTTTLVIGEETADEGVRRMYDVTPPGWVVIPSGGGFPDPMTTRGDIIIRDAANITARLPVGGANTFLSSDGTDPSWSNVDISTADITGTLPVGNGGTGQVTVQAAIDALSQFTARGDILVRDAAGNAVVLPLGAVNTFLRSDGADLLYSNVDISTADVTGTLPVGNGGTGQVTIQAAINSLSQFTTRGDILVANATPDAVRLPLGGTGTVLRSDGTDAAWLALPIGDIDSSAIAAGVPFSSDGTNPVSGLDTGYVQVAGGPGNIGPPGATFAASPTICGLVTPATGTTNQFTVTGHVVHAAPFGAYGFDIGLTDAAGTVHAAAQIRQDVGPAPGAISIYSFSLQADLGPGLSVEVRAKDTAGVAGVYLENVQMRRVLVA
jgi:hypothetical protein